MRNCAGGTRRVGREVRKTKQIAFFHAKCFYPVLPNEISEEKRDWIALCACARVCVCGASVWMRCSRKRSRSTTTTNAGTERRKRKKKRKKSEKEEALTATASSYCLCVGQTEAPKCLVTPYYTRIPFKWSNGKPKNARARSTALVSAQAMPDSLWKHRKHTNSTQPTPSTGNQKEEKSQHETRTILLNEHEAVQHFPHPSTHIHPSIQHLIRRIQIIISCSSSGSTRSAPHTQLLAVCQVYRQLVDGWLLVMMVTAW